MPQRLAAAGSRHRRRPSGGSGTRRSGPSTPLLRWSPEDPVSLPPDGISKHEKMVNNRATMGDSANGGEPTKDFSVRRLAAAVWRLRPTEFVAACGDGGGVGGPGRCSMVDFEVRNC
jgi:hypothetical protein